MFVTTVPVTLEVFLAPFARHFRDLGWRIDGIANGASTREALRDSFDQLHDASWTRNPLSPSNLLGTARRVRRLVAENGYDIVHAHTPIAAFVTRYALRRRTDGRRPVVIYTAHGFHFYGGQKRMSGVAFRAMERLAARWTDYLVTINDEDFSAAQALGTIPRERVRLIPGIGVDTERFSCRAVDSAMRDAIRKEFGVSASAFLVLMIAEFAPVKRHEHLLRALARSRSGNVVVIFAGEGPLEPATHALAAELGIEDRVRWAGYRSDVPALVSASDALALVSEREGLARSVLEGMAGGKPVIGTQTRGIADLIGEGAGWVVPKDDVDALAAAIDAAASDREEARRRGERGREATERRYDLTHIIRQYEELYDEALASRV